MESNYQFNNLEKAILRWVEENYTDPNFLVQVRAAKFRKRTWTKVGFYVDLEVPKNLLPINFSLFERKGFPIYGPNIMSDDIEFGGVSLLWGKGGHIDCIEMAAFGSFFREHVNDFKLEGNRARKNLI